MSLKDTIIEIKIRLDRGNSLVYWTRNLIIISAGMKYLLTLNLLQSILFFIFLLLFFYLLGWLDLNVFHFQQRETQILTEKYNYYFQNLKKQINRKI